MSLELSASGDMRGKVVVVTGAASGIGRATAELLLRHGAKVYGCDLDRSAVANGLAAREGMIDVALDVSDKAAVDTLFRRVTAADGRLDGLVASAGVMSDVPLDMLDEVELDRVLSINLKGTLWCCQAAAAIMRQAKTGSIITLSSMAAERGAPRIGAYAMSKGAVVQLTRILALELATEGVRVNGISPGVIMTSMTQRHFTRLDGSIDETARAAVIERLAAVAPMNRIGEADEVARAALYLLSDDSSFVTGQILRVNGGAFLA